jgi:hypothetical protein
MLMDIKDDWMGLGARIRGEEHALGHRFIFGTLLFHALA